MSFQRIARHAATRLSRAKLVMPRRVQTNRTLLNLLRRSKPDTEKPDPVPILSQDNLFHPFSKSPFPAVRARGEAICSLAPCPICTDDRHDDLEHPKPYPKSVAFECPDCGWPTHCSEEHWKQDSEHEKYCSRLRQVNKDEHDLRSGRRLREFELPGTCSSLSLYDLIIFISFNHC